MPTGFRARPANPHWLDPTRPVAFWLVDSIRRRYRWARTLTQPLQ